MGAVKATKNVKFVVLDLPGTVEQGRAALPKEYDGRIEFMVHDFFGEQTPKKAAPEAYLFGWIFRNWIHGYCLKILRNLIPFLDDGTRVLIYKYIVSDYPETVVMEKTGL